MSVLQASNTKDVDTKSSAFDAADVGETRIIDQGYRAYDGHRRGLWGSIRSMVFYSVRHVLGIGRKFRYKLLAGFAITFAVFPALVFLGLAVAPDFRLESSDALPSYERYHIVYIAPALVFFSSIVIPSVLVEDRRNSMLVYYLSTPLRIWSYLTSKVLAVISTLSVITIVPILILLTAHIAENVGPSGIDEWALLCGRILLSGLVAVAVVAAVSMAAASYVDRRGLAAAAVILLLLGSWVITAILVRGGSDARVYGFHVLGISSEMVNRIYGVEPDPVPALQSIDLETLSGDQDPSTTNPPSISTTQQTQHLSDLSTLFVISAYMAWTLVGAFVVWFGYRRRGVSG